MLHFQRAFALVRSLLTDDFGGSATSKALFISLSASAVLVVIRIGTALAAVH